MSKTTAKETVEVLPAHPINPPEPVIFSQDHFAQLQSQIEKLQKSVNRMDADMAEDRKDIGELKTRQGTIDAQQAEILDRMNRQTQTIVNKVTDSVEDTVSESVAPVQDTLDTFVKNKSKIIYIKEQSGNIFSRILRFLMFWRK